MQNCDSERCARAFPSVLRLSLIHIFRIMLVDREHLGSGWARLWAGYKESRRILRDRAWEPMPPLE